MEAFEEAQEQIKTGKQHHSHKTKSGNVFQSELIKIVHIRINTLLNASNFSVAIGHKMYVLTETI